MHVTAEQPETTINRSLKSSYTLSEYVHREAPGFDTTGCPAWPNIGLPSFAINAVPGQGCLLPGPFPPFLCAVAPSFHYMFLPWNFLCTRHIVYPKDPWYSTPTIRKLLRTCDVQLSVAPSIYGLDSGTRMRSSHFPYMREKEKETRHGKECLSLLPLSGAMRRPVLLSARARPKSVCIC